MAWKLRVRLSSRETLAIEYRGIPRSSLGFGQRAVYRDGIPEHRSGLTFQADEDDKDTDLEDAEDPMSRAQLTEGSLPLGILASFMGKESGYDLDTRLMYHSLYLLMTVLQYTFLSAELCRFLVLPFYCLEKSDGL